MSPIELYVVTVLIFYACCASIFLCARSTKNYTRIKDIKNACTNLERSVKKDAVLWGVVWPIWFVKLLLKRSN